MPVVVEAAVWGSTRHCLEVCTGISLTLQQEMNSEHLKVLLANLVQKIEWEQTTFKKFLVL